MASRADPFAVLDLKRGQFRVVRIIARLNVGGPAQHVLHLTRGLADRYPTLLITGDVADGEVELPYAGTDVTVFRIPELGRRVRLLQDVTAFVKILRVLRAVRPQVVHTHTAKAGALGRVAAFIAGVPVRVHTFHGHVFDGYFAPLVSRVVVWIERALARITTRVIAISEQQARDLTVGYRVCGMDRLAVVPLGLDLAGFRTADAARLRQEFRTELDAGSCHVITAVGRLVPIKNHEMLLRMARQLARERRDFLVIIVGDGTERARLEQLSSEYGVVEHVRFLGWRSDLPRIYAGSDVVALPSRNEGTPVCLIEALAAGVPVVATDVGGVRDIIRHGASGLLVPRDDADALTRAVRSLLDGEHARQPLVRAGPESAELFSVRRLLSDIGAVYDREIARIPRAGGRSAARAPATIAAPGVAISHDSPERG